MANHDWRAALEEIAGGYREDMADPFALGGWSVATQGQVLLAAEVDFAETPCPEFAKDRVTRLVFGHAFGDAREVSVRAVREWAGEPEPPCPDCTEEDRERACEECGGTGEVECVCFACDNYHFTECPVCMGEGGGFCKTCEGEGVVPLLAHEGRVARVGDTRSNKGLWALLFQNVPDGTCRVVAGPDDESPIIIAGDGWRGAIMPLRAVHMSRTEDPEPIPELAPTP